MLQPGNLSFFFPSRKNGVEMRVVLGGVDIEKDEAYDQVIPVEKAVVHEAYNQTPFALYNDVGEAQM